MRSSKSRSRSKTNRPRTVGNIVNRVFDSSGPEGKVRGTPQQIIEKYLFLARDAQLSNDRVAAENFLQHAEHYTRMLGEAQRELAAEMEARPPQQQQNYQGGQNGQNGQPREGYRDQQPREQQPYRDQPRDQQQPREQQQRDQQPRDGYRDQPRDQQPRRDDREYRADYARDISIDDQPYTRRIEQNEPMVDETGLVETPESRARSDQRRATEEAAERSDAPRQEQQPRGDRPERKDRPERRPDRRQDQRPRRDETQPVAAVEAAAVESDTAPVEVQSVPEPVHVDAPAPKPRAPRKPRVAKTEGVTTPPDGSREAVE